MSSPLSSLCPLCIPLPASILHYIQELLPDLAASVLGEEVCGLRDMTDLVRELDTAIGEPQTSQCDYISSGRNKRSTRNTLHLNLSVQTPLGQTKVSLLVKCPDFRDCNVHKQGGQDTELCRVCPERCPFREPSIKVSIVYIYNEVCEVTIVAFPLLFLCVLPPLCYGY